MPGVSSGAAVAMQAGMGDVPDLPTIERADWNTIEGALAHEVATHRHAGAFMLAEHVEKTLAKVRAHHEAATRADRDAIDADRPIVLDVANMSTSAIGSHPHVHDLNGRCVKRRSGPRCDALGEG